MQALAALQRDADAALQKVTARADGLRADEIKRLVEADEEAALAAFVKWLM
jgi:hypothetical protein